MTNVILFYCGCPNSVSFEKLNLSISRNDELSHGLPDGSCCCCLCDHYPYGLKYILIMRIYYIYTKIKG